MKRSVTYSVLAASIFAAMAFPAFAADATADSNVTTKDVIVTATRTEQEVKNVPSASQVITAEDIQKLGATDVYQALALADGVQVRPSNTGFGKTVLLRNMPTNTSLILVNGHRIANEDTEVQNMNTLGRINVNNIERIEIVRGAASAQYGSDAQSGVINIITKKSGKQESITVGASTGSESINNYYHVETGDIGKFSGTLDVNVGKDRYRMMDDGSMGYLYGPKQNISFNGNYNFNDHQALNFDTSYFKSKQLADWSGAMGEMDNGFKAMIYGMAGKNTALGDAIYNKYFPYGLTKAKFDNEQKDFSISFNGKTDKNDYNVRAYYSHLVADRFLPEQVFGHLSGDASIYKNIPKDFAHYYRPGVPAGIAPDLTEHNTYSVYGLEAKDSMAIGDSHLLTFGGDYVKNKIDGSNLKDGAKATNTASAYIQDEWMVGDKLLVIPAIRYDHHSQFGNKTTPKIGATYFINNNNRFKINWGKGFKAPSVTQLYAYFYHNVYIKGNADLIPEESQNFDVSYETEFGKNYGKITYFDNKIENMIDYVDVAGVAKTKQYINLPGTTKVHGVELTLGRQISNNWDFRIDSNWTSSNNDTVGTGHATVGLAKNITTTQLTYDDLKPYGFNFVLWDQFYSDYRGTNGKDYTYNTLNFTITKKYGEDKRVFVGLDNLFDKVVGDINVDGRMWRAGAEVKF